MKYKNVLILGLVIICYSGYGQKIFRDGYIIKNSGDTLNGLIQFKEKQNKISECVFKRFDIGQIVQYPPDQIKAFGYKNGNCYKSQKVNRKNVFLECLVQGKLSLYTSGNNLYIQKENQNLIEIKKKHFNATVDNVNTEFPNLNSLFEDITKDAAGFEIPQNIKVDNSSILQLVVDYNKRISSAYIVFERNYDENLFDEATMLTGINMASFGIINSLNINNGATLESKSDYHFNDIPNVTSSSKNWAIGIFLNHKISRVDTRWSFQSELQFIKQSNYFYAVLQRIYPTQTHRVDITTDVSIIKFPLLFRYSYSIKRMDFFANLGCSYNLVFANYKKVTLEAESTTNEIYTYESDDANKKSNYNLISGFVGFGFKYKILNDRFVYFETRYEISPEVTQSIAFDYYYTPKFKLNQGFSGFQFIVGIGI